MSTLVVSIVFALATFSGIFWKFGSSEVEELVAQYTTPAQRDFRGQQTT